MNSRRLLLGIASALLTCELVAFFASYHRLLRVNVVPTLWVPVVGDLGKDTTAQWYTERDAWGAWHHPNTRARHVGMCFDVEYASNEVGARDDSFETDDSSSRWILLGDSFAQGNGVDSSETVAALLEKALGISVLNFGSAGNVGPVQYHLIFRQLASKYPHRGVILFFLPANDFTDNDWTFWSKAGIAQVDGVVRYRPYWKYVSPGVFDWFIPEDAVKRSDWAPKRPVGPNDVRSGGFGWCKAALWSCNLVRTAQWVIHDWRLSAHQVTADERGRGKRLYSGYFDAPLRQQEAALSFIRQIVNETEPSDLLIVSIPTLSDILRRDGQAAAPDPFWKREMVRMSRESGGRVAYLDLLEESPPGAADLFLGCDGHWSAKGNRWASAVIERAIEKWVGPAGPARRAQESTN